jgi:Raf kinase inhibitor-like YbhB/YbcL family protein
MRAVFDTLMLPDAGGNGLDVASAGATWRNARTPPAGVCFGDEEPSGGIVMRAIVSMLLSMLAFAAPAALAAGETNMLSITSSAFAAGQAIPKKYTCEGGDRSPPLAWSGAPSGTKTFALIVDDPDAPDPAAPKMTYVHWVLYNVPAATVQLAEGASGTALPAGAGEGRNDFGRTNYGGPCPPIGRHRYFFKLYALDIELPAGKANDKPALEAAMKGHVLAHAELMGTYQKGG